MSGEALDLALDRLNQSMRAQPQRKVHVRKCRGCGDPIIWTINRWGNYVPIEAHTFRPHTAGWSGKTPRFDRTEHACHLDVCTNPPARTKSG
ncbi:MAG: hypothetical protein AAF515_05160 [Pseudomonadota bacterium]